MINVNQVKYYREDDKKYGDTRVQEMADEDPIFNMDLNKARKFIVEAPEDGSNDNMLKLTEGGWSGKVCEANINETEYPKWMVNFKNEPNAVNQHFCLLHKHDYLALPAQTWTKPCDQCEDLKEGKYVLFCYTCNIKICEECHQKKHQDFIQDYEEKVDVINVGSLHCPNWLTERGAANYHSCNKHQHPLEILTPPLEDVLTICNFCEKIIEDEAILKCLDCDTYQCESCHDKVIIPTIDDKDPDKLGSEEQSETGDCEGFNNSDRSEWLWVEDEKENKEEVAVTTADLKKGDDLLESTTPKKCRLLKSNLESATKLNTMIDGEDHHTAGEPTKEVECKDSNESTVVGATNNKDEDIVIIDDIQLVQQCHTPMDKINKNG